MAGTNLLRKLNRNVALAHSIKEQKTKLALAK